MSYFLHHADDFYVFSRAAAKILYIIPECSILIVLYQGEDLEIIIKKEII